LLLTHPNPTPASLTLPNGRRPKLLFLAAEELLREAAGGR